jgi:cholest-4-en-3-one 26-monooxygenase
MDASDIDFLDKTSFERGLHHEWLTWLRRNAPVYRHPEPDGPGFWVLSKHTDIAAVSRNSAMFSSDSENGGILGLTAAERAPVTLTFKGAKNIALMDPPEHTPYRAAVERAFRPRSVKEMEDQVRGMVTRVLDEAIARQDVDFVDDVAGRITIGILAEQLGAPETDLPHLYELANLAVGADDPEYLQSFMDQLSGPGPIVREMVRAAQEFGFGGVRLLPFLWRASPTERRSYLALYKGRGDLQRYARRLIEARRTDPRTDDLVTKLLAADVDGAPMSDQHIMLYLELFLTAGHETTRTAMAHGIERFLAHPEAYADLRSDPSAIPTAVEEILRWSTPVQYFRRAALEDGEIGGQQIARGDSVMLWYLSGNRDEDVFSDPFTFDIRRSPNNHLAFGGGGVHFCLGSKLARLELQIFLEELTQRVPEMESLGDPRFLRSSSINGIKHLPVRIRSRSRKEAVAGRDVQDGATS